ncbi:metallophosphoesterase family protein [Ramlibacter sp. MAHUQ-53]|uniref:metallophosphoesterase family protein n=1 Tax=unclassified Ramlibacter TaxID=2617605 RepID=UPI00363D6BC9
MGLLLHLSDTHFGTEEPAVVEAVVRLAAGRRPDAVVLSGDITQRATRAQFAAARAFCERLGPAPRLVLPGNHDLPLFDLASRVARPLGRFRQAFGDEEPVLRLPGAIVVGVNTTRWWRHKDGEVCAAQVARVAGLLREAGRGVLRVVVTHHPAAVVRAQDRENLLIGADAALAAWSRAGADLLLGGHIHLPYVADLSGAPWSLSRPLWCVQAGTAVSRRVRHDTRHSLNLVAWGSAGCEVERLDYDLAADAFVTVQRRPLALGP